MSLANNIPSVQTSEPSIRLLRARQNTYNAAKWTQGIFVFVSIALPVISALCGKWDTAKPYFATAGLVLLFLDVALLDRLQKDRLKRGAKLQEEFDTKVMELPWNKFVAGDKVSPEDVREASIKPLSRMREGEISSWYEKCAGEVPLHFGRLICQRTNISYDSRLRRRYGVWLLTLTGIVGIVLLVITLALDPKISDAIMTFWVPFSPILSWVIREYRKQLDTAGSLTNLQSDWKAMWAEAIQGASENDMARRSRQLQDAIYQHRASAPLVFDWIYRFLRAKNEDEAHHAANELVAEVNAALAGRAGS